ncbi:MAG: glycogen synthase [Steroidobacteraceae bacterium]
MTQPLAVCLLASEVAPFSKTGGLADVTAALAKQLCAAGHDARLFTPHYTAPAGHAAAAAAPPAERLSGLTALPLTVGAHRFEFSVLRASLPGGAPVYLIDCPALYARGTFYTDDADEHVRFLAFTRAVFTACQRLRWAPAILHCNDWHAGFGPLLLQADYRDTASFAATRSVLTIHNIGYQGIFPATDVDDLGLGERSGLLYGPDLAAGRINALRHGILHADAITTVSPTHAREICTPEYGMGLDDTLRARSGVLSGILNGVDYEEWDPRHDRYLPAHYDAEHPGAKGGLKRMLLARLGLGGAPEAPLAGIVSRLAVQKGIELMFEALPKVLATRDLSLVALGSGEARYEEFFASLAREFPERVAFRQGHDEELAHWIEAASDLFLMPSRYEPCGLNQMYSLRYGTVPVVRRTGGLADSVEHYDPARGTGDGVVFNHFDVPALEWAVNTALDLYAQPQHWRRMMKNGMRKDFSWERQAARYLELYRRVTAAA